MLQLIDIRFCGMDLENAQSVADDVLDMHLSVFSFDLVFHKLKNILDVGPKNAEAEVYGAESYVLALGRKA